jgi:hypothetical protein
MRNVLAAEGSRLLRRGMLLGILAVVGLGVLTSAIIFGQSSSGDERGPGVVPTAELEASDGLVKAFAFSSQIVGGAALVLYARSVTNDYQHGTLKVYLTREPRRLVFLSAKFLAMTAFLGVTLLVLLAAMIITASVVGGARGIDMSAWWTGEGVAATTFGFLRLAAAAMVWGLFGFALGTLLRSSGPAIGVGIGVFAIGGHLIENFWTNGGEWFPSLVLAVFTAGGTDTVSLGLASLMTALYAVILAGLSAFGFTRGDVPG